MTSFWEISLTGKITLGILCMLVSALSIYIFTTSCVRNTGIRYIMLSLVPASASTLMFIGISNVFAVIDIDVNPTQLASAVGSLSWIAILSLLLIFFGVDIALTARLQSVRRKKISPEAIKEAVDILPDGICFSTEDGLPLLVNVQMNRLCAMLTGTSLTNAKCFWNDLYFGQFKTIVKYRSTSPSTTLEFSDRSVWDFRRHIINVDGKEVCELLAFDITALYRLNRELKERNERLGAVRDRLRRFGNEVEHVTREKEILSARIKVHDDVGRLLLALRSYLEKPESERDRKTLLPLWNYTISVLNKKEVAANSVDYDKILSDAEAIGVTVTRSGEYKDMPQNDLTREILLTALRECVSNTVKHAGGNKLNFSLTRSEDLLIAEFTNNGKPPEGRINETGGLRNLRFTVERANGNMMISALPRFVLRLELPADTVFLYERDKEKLHV